MILGIDVVFLHVKEPVKMAQWYKEKLGLDISYRSPNNDWQEFTFNDNNITTRFALDYKGKKPSPIEQQPIMLSFLVDDIEIAVEKLELKGIEFIGKNKIVNIDSSLVATFQDPEGNYLQLSCKKKMC